jgi:DNA-directed RNA polymerase specialized sigma subunit
VLKAVEEIVDKFGYRIIEITEEINKWLDMQQDITKIMYSTDNIVLTLEERRIIELRYFNQYHCQRVANIVKYSKMQVYRISDKAIDKIQCEYDKVKLNKSA